MKEEAKKHGLVMDRPSGDRTVSFRPHLAGPLPSYTTSNGSTLDTDASPRIPSTVTQGYAPLSPSTSALRTRRVASHRRLQGGSPGRGSGSTRSDVSFEAPAQLATLLQRSGSPSVTTIIPPQLRSVDSMADIVSAAPPMMQSPAGPYFDSASPTTVGRDNAMMQELIALQQQQQSNLKGVTVIYPQRVSPTEGHGRMPDFPSPHDAQSIGEDSANEDRVQVRVEGYYDGANVNVLIPNDLPPSTLLYVLTASDGRDLMFKLTQYSLQLAICFLKMPSLFSPEVQVFTGPWAERLYRNYNTIRHGRSLFKMGRGLLNVFTVQAVCERMWMRYENAISRQSCGVLLPVVTRVEQVLLMLGASPVWGRAMSRQLLHWSQAAELTPGQGRLEESPEAMAMDRRIQERMQGKKDSIYPGALLADDTFMHISEVERGEPGSGGAGGGNKAGTSGKQEDADRSGLLQRMANASFTDLAIHTAMNAIGISVPRGGPSAGPRNFAASPPPSQPVLPHSPADEESTSPEHSSKASPRSFRGAFPSPTSPATNDATSAATPASDAKGSTDSTKEPAKGTAPTTSNTANGPDPITVDQAGRTPATTEATSTVASTGKQRVDTSTSSSADDGSGPIEHAEAPPYVQGTLPEFPQHDHLPGMTPSKTTTATTATATQPMMDSYNVAEGEEDGGRTTLLRPLTRPTRRSSTTDPDGSITGDEGPSSMPNAAGPHFAGEPMSMMDNWRPAMAPTVPPSQSDEYGYGTTPGFADHAGHLSPTSPSPPPQSSGKKAKDCNGVAARSKKAPVRSSDRDTATAAAAAVSSTSSMDDGAALDGNLASAKHAHEEQRRPKRECPPFETDPALQAPPAPGPAGSPVSPSSSLSATPKQAVNEELNESDMSILSSEANSSFHVRPGGVSRTMTAWLNELQPASAALPARLRKGIMQFNPVLMTLLGIRNVAAGLRRFLRDATLISSERLTAVTFIEVHRRSITRFINRCWFIISVIDLLLNTVRLLQPGWTKYATARQNIRCRCGCQGDDDPADTVFRTHGFIARRKTDLFFPPLNLDYGAPVVSSIAYVEAADPARLMPACSRCGCLYKELPCEAAAFEGEGGDEDEAAATSSTAGGPAPLPIATGGSAAHPRPSPFLVPSGHPSRTLSDTGDNSFAIGAMQREKPRWVQMYEAEVHEAEEARRRTAAKTATPDAAGAGGSGGGRGNMARRATQKPSSDTKANADADGAGRTTAAELVDLAPPPPMGNTAVRPLHPQPSRDTNDAFVPGEAAAAAEGPSKGTTGILFVPWMMRKFFDYVWLLRVHPNLTATILLEARYLAEFYLSYKYCFTDYESYKGDAPLNAILHPYCAIAGMVSAAVGLLRVVESAPTS
ncbi:hypothetical protein ABB37_08172 [Leptomonas pyrrhocoris]|uniref:Uncharacterized protein n=1 Tax=Leptomonas pyrrhocoris TaxID=157538 RepID=A0A0M9FTY3_LEPPY|nr:hypothetical protein ABB37_08172 [Leptomonas pyrrhocoris]KPA76030.1 hypothetical protein ABB37_08172 [Leptomonas pyrrhocoris]|eukprot:XP_015654469.1 hypothetical protein ABB37_08172 [Leptomonas pyrrhocoris]